MDAVSTRIFSICNSEDLDRPLHSAKVLSVDMETFWAGNSLREKIKN